MTRVSLKEAYDNKDVVAQIYAIRDIAEGAEDTANNAVSTANTASEHVDALVPQVEGAVQNANNASASAQQSAQTVAGYDDRLTAAETKNTQQDTDIGALQTADTNNVKLKPAGDQHISGTLFIDAWTAYGPQQFNLRGTQTDGWKKIGISDSQGDVTRIQMNRDEIQLVGDKIYRNTLPSGADSRNIINKAYVESTDEVTNNLVHRTANETITGTKTFTSQYGTTSIGLKGLNSDVTAQSYQASIPRIGAYDKNDEQLWQLETAINADGTVSLNCRIRNSDGTIKTVTLVKGDVKQ